MEKLELKHLAPYLPYGLKIYEPIQEKGLIIDIKMTSYNSEKIGLPSLFEYGYYKIQYGLPILRPLSDLTKEIEYKGNIFVPLEKISEEFTSEIDFIEGNKVVWQKMNPHGTIDYSLWFEIIKFEDELIIIEHINCDGKDNQNPITYSCHVQLCEWHFDVFGLIDKGLAIDINTL